MPSPPAPFRVAIGPASGIISGPSPDIPQEGPCADLWRRAARLGIQTVVQGTTLGWAMSDSHSAKEEDDG